MTVQAPIELPSIPELLDQRTIPDPHPDIVLVIALEDLMDTQRLQVYCSCPALQMERAPLGPLPFSLADIVWLRQTVIQYASAIRSLAPDEVQKSLQQLGATVFDQLMPPGHELRATYWKFRNLATNIATPLSWLIIADEPALLPWELICPYEGQAPPSELDYDDFLADSFVLSHWVARQGLPIQAEAPLGWLALDHYWQYLSRLPQWHAVLADETLDELEQPVEGYLALQHPDLPYYGLHVLRYHDPDRGTRITTAQEREPGEAMPLRSDAERMTYERRLDFTRKRPVIGLSLVEEDALQLDTRVSQRDTQLEAGWFLPFMHAGASAQHSS